MIYYVLKNKKNNNYMTIGWRFNTSDISKAYLYKDLKSAIGNCSLMLTKKEQKDIAIIKVTFGTVALEEINWRALKENQDEEDRD